MVFCDINTTCLLQQFVIAVFLFKYQLIQLSLMVKSNLWIVYGGTIRSPVGQKRETTSHYSGNPFIFLFHTLFLRSHVFRNTLFKCINRSFKQWVKLGFLKLQGSCFTTSPSQFVLQLLYDFQRHRMGPLWDQCHRP